MEYSCESHTINKSYVRTEVVKPKKSQVGLTLLEVLIVLVITAVLLNIAAPSFGSAVSKAKLAATANSLAQSIHFGRSEAVKRSVSVSICARNTNISCNTENEWSAGWLVYTDSASAGDAGVLDGDDAVLRIVNLKEGNIEIDANAVVNAEASSLVNNIRFNARGFANWTAGTFALCTGQSETAKSLIVLGAGAVRSTSASVNSLAKDAFDNDIECE